MVATILISISGHFAGFTYVRPFLEQVPALKIDIISLALLGYGVGGFFRQPGRRGHHGAQRPGLGHRRIRVDRGDVSRPGRVRRLALGGRHWGRGLGLRLPGAIPVGAQTWIVRAAPDQPEGASGIIVAAFQVAIASGAVLGGLLVDHLGPTGVIGYCGVTTLLGALLVLGFGRRRRDHLAETAFDQHTEGDGAVADAVLLVGIHLAEGDCVAVGPEDRIVAEAAIAARRVGQRAEDLAFRTPR